jgi:hypothetical protein
MATTTRGATPTPTTAPTTQPTTQPTTAQPPPPTTETTPPVVTNTVTAPTTAPPSTQVLTSVVIQSAPQQQPTQQQDTTVVVTQSLPSTYTNGQTTGIPTTSSSSSTGGAHHSSGLSSAGKTAIAVVIPILAVGALIFVAILLWRRRARNQAAEEERRKEVEAYGYNPNDQSGIGRATLPAVAAGDDENLPELPGAGVAAAGAGYGYRGWGGPATGGVGARAPSSTAVSNSPPYPENSMYAGAKSPAQGYHDGASDGYGPGHTRNGTMDSETIGVMGAAGAQPPLNRGPSNASSTYSTGQASRHSAGDDYPIPLVPGQHPQQDPYYPVAPPGGGDPYYQPQPGQYQTYNPHMAQRQQQQQYGAGGQAVMRDGPGRTLGHIHEADAQPPHDEIARNF